MTYETFAEIFAMLAIQLRATDVDEAAGRAYFAALKDLEPEFVTEAAIRMGKQGGTSQAENRHWFPKTSEWRAMVDAVEVERIEQLRARLRKLPAPLCRGCGDTGWERDEHTNRVHRCSCVTLRRLEILGRRPLPELPEANIQPADPEALEKVRAMLRPLVEGKAL